MVRRPVTVAALALVVTLAGCADPSPGASDGAVGDPSPTVAEPGDPILRLSYEGGFVPPEWHVLDLPAFTLYADGTVIVPGAQIAIYPAPALPAIARRQVDDAAIEAIVDRAVESGLGRGDLDLSDTGDVGIADASTAVFTLTADGRTTTARVYALGLEEGPGAMPGLGERELEQRRALSELAAALGDLTWVEEQGGTLGPEEPYRGEGAIVLIAPVRREAGLPQDPIRWPLGSPLRSLGSAVTWSEDIRCAVVDGADWKSLRRAAEDANQLTPWVDGRSERSLAFRPLLPDEPGC